MPVTVPDSHKDLLEGAVFAVFTTISPEGNPENTIVWCSWDGEYALVNTAAGRRKDKNVRRNPQVALTALDPENPWRWIDVRGVVEEIVPDPDYSNINKHAQIYTGAEEYYGGVAPAEMKGTEERVIFKIKPTRVVAFPGN